MADKIKRPRLMVLNEPDGRRFSRALAMEIGRDHAEVFLQIEYLISISTTPELDNRLWTRQSLNSLQEEHFPYWGRSFLAEIIEDLCSGYMHARRSFDGKGRNRKVSTDKVEVPPLLIRAWHNTWPGDTTSWFSLNEDGISTLKSVYIDIAAMAVSAEWKRVSRKRKPVSVKQTQVSAECTPVSSHSDTFISETPTETPTEEGFPLAVPFLSAQQQVDQFLKG